MTALLLEPPLAAYVHFPWCVRKCPYCDFNSFTLQGTLPQEAYLDALAADVAAQAAVTGRRRLASVFLGGGTPSLFAPGAIGRVLGLLRAHFDTDPSLEVTLEANPATIERGIFAEYRAAGVNRVSLGAQSFDPQVLRVLGRVHSPDDTRRAAAELHAAGLPNFNLDLMFALPGQDVAGALADLRAALALEPAHVSHYQLTLEPGTVFAAQPPAGLPDDDVAWSMQAESHALLEAAGFGRYEVSAFARAGRQCAHNQNYWRFGDYLGLGAGAHGKLTFAGAGRIERTTQQREPRRYQAEPVAGLARRVVPAADLPFEYAMNALRLLEGFQLADYAARTGNDPAPLRAVLEGLAERGLVEPAPPGGWRASDLGFRFLNDVLSAFLGGPDERRKPAGQLAV